MNSTSHRRAHADVSGGQSATPPLEGVRVLDLTHRLAGPTMTMLLGDWGADVIKIEWWKRMDAWRGVISVDHDTERKKIYNSRPNWLKLNRSKRSLTLNLKTEHGKQLFLDLARECDIVADNFSAGVMDRLGLGYSVLSAVNPRMIMISMPGFGLSGPHATYVSNGATIEGYAGLASMTGYEGGSPRNSVNIWPDPVAGIHGAVAVAMALVKRQETGRGQHIELSQAEALVNMIGEAVLAFNATGTVAKPAGNADPQIAPHGVYPCAGEDRWISIAARTEHEWQALSNVEGSNGWASDPRFKTNDRRMAHREELDAAISSWTVTEDAWPLADRLQRSGVPAAVVATRQDLLSIPGVPSDDFWVELDHPHQRIYPGPAGRMNGASPRIQRHPPDLGADTDEILKELLGISDGDLEHLRAADII